MHVNLNLHYPKTYLNAWAQGVRPDWAEFLDKVFCDDVPSLLGSSPGVVLDLGCGPSICNIISASRWSNRIFLAELLEANRREVSKYLNGDEDAWNWRPYYEFHVSCFL